MNRICRAFLRFVNNDKLGVAVSIFLNKSMVTTLELHTF